MFRNRIDAGERLAERLKSYGGNRNRLVIGLPRGGVPVAAVVAKKLGLPLDILSVRKIGAPGNEEFAVGALSYTGEEVWNERALQWLDLKKEELAPTVERERQRAVDRQKLYRQGREPLVLKGKKILLIDDGLATGSTMKAAVASAYAMGCEEVVLAIPVAPPDTIEQFQELVDQVICLEIPPNFAAVGQFYEHFGQTTDEEVITLLENPSQC